MPMITKRAGAADAGIKTVRDAMKVFNFGARCSTGSYMADRLNEQLELVNTRGNDDSGGRRKYRFNPSVNARSVRKAAKGVGDRLTKTGERVELMRRLLGIRKTALLQVDPLGKMTSPAMQGERVDAPMPQTNYAKNTLENEFAERLNKKQLVEMNRLRQQQDSSQSTQSQTSSTTQNGVTTTTTTSGLANSGLMAALSVGSTI